MKELGEQGEKCPSSRGSLSESISCCVPHLESRIRLFSTAPQSADFEGRNYALHLATIAQWSEHAGCTGMLIYSDNSLIDPWMAAQLVVTHTSTLSPLVAIQPIYMHPYSAAKMVASLGFLYGRKVYLNMIAGGFRGDLLSLSDPTAHDDRYARLEEHTHLIMRLLSSTRPVNFSGRFYQVNNLQLKPCLDPELLPEVFVSGTSDAGKRTAKSLDAVSIEYPGPGAQYLDSPAGTRSGVRIGIIAADEDEKAWEKARNRFPGDKAGQLKHLMAMKMSDSQWHRKLSMIEHSEQSPNDIYWLWPFKNYNTFCPYLVGSYETVAAEVAKYIRAGFMDYILDIPRELSDLEDARVIFRKAEMSLDNEAVAV